MDSQPGPNPSAPVIETGLGLGSTRVITGWSLIVFAFLIPLLSFAIQFGTYKEVRLAEKLDMMMSFDHVVFVFPPAAIFCACAGAMLLQKASWRFALLYTVWFALFAVGTFYFLLGNSLRT